MIVKRFILFVIVTFMTSLCFSQTPSTYSYGEFVQSVYVKNKESGEVRKLERYGYRQGDNWGDWVESYCEKPYQDDYSYNNLVWPKRIKREEVKRLLNNASIVLGDNLFEYFEKKKNKIETSEWYNFTGIKGYRGAGPQGVIR